MKTKISLTLCILLLSVNIGAQTQTYKFGLLLPVTGANASIGLDIKEGAETFMDFMRNNNGFKQFTIDFLLFNSESKQDVAEQLIAYIEAKADDYYGFAGGVTDFEADAMAKTAEITKTPYIFPLRIAFKDKLNEYYFPVLPSLYASFKYLIGFFKYKERPVKVVYDDATKADAFLLTEPENLLELKDPDFEKKITKTTIVYVSNANAEEALKKIGANSMKFMNYHQLNLVSAAKDQTVWENVIFLNWTKPETITEVKFFKETFQKMNHGKEPNNFHMLGWMMADMIYEASYRAFTSMNGPFTKTDFVKALESFASTGGYDNGVGYKVMYSPFLSTNDQSRAGISGVYFLRYNKGGFVVVSEFLNLY